MKHHLKEVNKRLNFKPKSSQKIKKLALKKLVRKVKNVTGKIS